VVLAERSASTVWEGDLDNGSGRVTVTSGALPEFPVTWAARTVRSDGKTSPEELIAAAQASCFAMALSSTLAKAGNVPEQLTVGATAVLDRFDGKVTITTINISVTGRVPGIDQNAFAAAAEDTGRDCPVARALKASVQINVDAQLESET
jgi:lipoyl-dependent peroxiredoxin